MKVVSRAQWGARRPKSRTLTSRQTRDTLHHTTGATLGSRTSAQWVKNIQDYHMDTLGWADIGYNWLVDSEGVVFEGRGDGVVGAHSSGFNATHRGIAYLGDATSNLPEKARASIKRLVGTRAHVGHRDQAATACPGTALYLWMRAGMPLAPTPAPKPTPAPPKEADVAAKNVLVQVLVRPEHAKEVTDILTKMGLRAYVVDVDAVRITRANPPGTPQ